MARPHEQFTQRHATYDKHKLYCDALLVAVLKSPKLMDHQRAHVETTRKILHGYPVHDTAIKSHTAAARMLWGFVEDKFTVVQSSGCVNDIEAYVNQWLEPEQRWALAALAYD